MSHLPDTPAAPADPESAVAAPATPPASPLTAQASETGLPAPDASAGEDAAEAVAMPESVAGDTEDDAEGNAAADPTAAEPPAAELAAGAEGVDLAAAGPTEVASALPRTPELSPAACADLLKQHFPALFIGPPKPLKLRIQQDIQQRVPGVFTKGALGAFFRRYTGSTGYLIALGKASHRFDLDGQPAGELSDEHRNLAREELTRRRQLGRERDQAAQAQQQAAQAEILQARQARLSLLRDFERTTLTLANFCALKGLTPDALTPQLDQARREAAEAPPPRPFDDRRGPPGPRRDDRSGPRTDGQRDARPPRMDRANPAGEARGTPDQPREQRRPAHRPDGRADGRPDNRADPRPQAARPPGRPGGRPGGR